MSPVSVRVDAEVHSARDHAAKTGHQGHEDCRTPAPEEVLHPVIRTYFLIENAAVLAQARISIICMCQNTYNYDVVLLEALRQSIGEKKLVTPDASATRETFKHVTNSGGTAEDEGGEPEAKEFGGDDTAFEVQDNWWDEDQL